MLDRFFKKTATTPQNQTSDKNGKPSLDDLEKNAQVLDNNKMNQIEGGFTSNSQINDRFDWNSSIGGSMPS